ncbi:MAG: hypothetical protein KGO92_08855, partial [Bacteroidota bacterium]|nr:hypothetical protein [Bacteroidota bacterium]
MQGIAAPGHSAIAYFAEDTIPPVKDSASLRNPNRFISTNNTDTVKKDSVVRVDTLLMSKDSVDAIIKYHADDSGVLIMSSKEMFLYG